MKPRLRAIVQKDLLEGISARVKELDGGGYARVYMSGGREYPTGLHALVSRVLDASGIEYSTDVPIYAGSPRRADFAIGDRLIRVGDDLSAEERRKAARAGRECVVISQSDSRSDVLDSGTRVRRPGDRAKERLQTIFLDDPSFNFDYAHILPKTEKWRPTTSTAPSWLRAGRWRRPGCSP